MNEINNYIPIITAIISAVVLVFGYIYSKKKERDFEISKIRQDIYLKLINNFTEKIRLLGSLKNNTNMPTRITEENVSSIMEYIKSNHPEINKNFDKTIEIMTLLSVYGSDKAIFACSRYYEKSIDSIKSSDVNVDPSELIAELRKSLFSKSKIDSSIIKLLMSK